MELIERDGLLASLRQIFQNVAGGEGHCVFISGEAGIGKTALVKAFCKEQADDCSIYMGACDALFTPRPLAPLYDILWQVNKDRWPIAAANEDRSAFFTSFFQELHTKKGKLLIVFEDIHWADEGTLDFIRFFARRISFLPCLFILTYRDDEIHSGHPLQNVLGQLPPDSFSKLMVTPLSKQAVVKMATHKGYNGEEVYSISEGNPFYVNEILASYSPGVPDSIKDSILSVYERQKQGTKNAWQVWSIMPEGLEIERVPKIKLSMDIDHCFAISVIIVQNGKVVFKHELYRRTIEESLTPFKRIALNKMMLELFLKDFEEKGEIERILHYAKNANEKELVVKYAPLAARKAALIGAHKEASKLFLTAIEYCETNDTDLLVELYGSYAHECYLSNQIKNAIVYEEKALHIWLEKMQTNQAGNSLCFLSRLWWFEGNRKKSEDFALRAVELMKEQPSPDANAMVFSNISELKMLSGESTESMSWGDKAIAMAKELDDKEILCHALNNVGSVQMRIASFKETGVELLQQSLEIALNNSYHEAAARAYTNLASNALKMKKYLAAKKAVEDGMRYCEEKGLDLWGTYMSSLNARLNLETGNWTAAYTIANDLLLNEGQPAIVRITALIVAATVTTRQGEHDVLSLLLEAKAKAFETKELQWVIPSMVALLEYEWLSAKPIIQKGDIDQTLALIQETDTNSKENEFAFWMWKAGRQRVPVNEIKEAYGIGSAERALKAAAAWENLGCPYEQALALFEGNDDDKRKAIGIVHELGATVVYKKMKQQMRHLNIKNIPRGIRKSTRSNAAFLTSREIDVLQLIRQGLQNKEIAAQLFISAKTVDHHISNLLFKLDASSRSKAVTEAVRLGILN
jgi:ATP/maltotriose-dependent transcriptional regulator MalT